VAEAGNYPSVVNKVLPIKRGIAGRVFQSGESEGWNNVLHCPSYHSLLDGKVDDTKAEITVPIQHLGITYGILDVQDDHVHVFRWDDVYTLEVIARILGVAISAEKTDLLVQDAYDLWEELSSHSYSEEAMFQEFAQFAEEKLGADVVTYYPLSPTGYPINPPLYHGNLYYPDRMTSGIQDPRSPLVQLIRDWKPTFSARVYPDSVFARFLKTDPPSFTIREKIESVCFVPVGTRKEYLGAMFLNYRTPRPFDGLFRFMVLSFSQTFAILASRERYKSILFEGFGRPELGVHNLFSRYGLKTGVREEGEKIFQRSCVEQPANFAECGMSPLFLRVDEFLRAVSLAQSSIPPMFLNESLADELENFISTLPIGKDGRRPPTQIDIDPRIERESAWSKLALYRLTTESMNNAVFHGQTNEIKATVRRENAHITVQITNNGIPLPIDLDVKRSRRGIYSLLNDLELKFGASTRISRGLDGTGTVVEAVFLALPLSDEV
jgi:GAF domain-containing protein